MMSSCSRSPIGAEFGLPKFGLPMSSVLSLESGSFSDDSVRAAPAPHKPRSQPLRGFAASNFWRCVSLADRAPHREGESRHFAQPGLDRIAYEPVPVFARRIERQATTDSN